jgi:hypothetical protein
MGCDLYESPLMANGRCEYVRWIGTGGSVLRRVCLTDMCVCVYVDMAVCFAPVSGTQLVWGPCFR